MTRSTILSRILAGAALMGAAASLAAAPAALCAEITRVSVPATIPTDRYAPLPSVSCPADFPYVLDRGLPTGHGYEVVAPNDGTVFWTMGRFAETTVDGIRYATGTTGGVVVNTADSPVTVSVVLHCTDTPARALAAR